jgi:outer membrane receptor protein involved in Fe transport
LVNIITKRRTADGFNTELSGSYGSWNTTEDYIMHYGKLGAFDYGVNYDFRYTGGAREQRGPYEFDSKYLSHNGTLHTGYQFNKNWYAALDGYIMKMDIHDPGAVGAPNLNNIEYFDVTRGGTSLSISNNYDKLDGSLQIYGNWGKHDANRPASNVDTYDSFDRIFGAKLKETLSLDSGTNLTGGAEYKNYGGRAKTKAPSPPGPADGIYVDNEYIQETSLYGLAEQSLFNNLLLLSAGARWTYSDEHGNYGAWQAGAIVNPAERTKLRFHSARGFKMPDISQTYNKMFGPIHPSSETGIDLKPETYTSFEAGIEQGITDILTASLTGYRIYSKNKFIMSPYSGGGTAWYNNSDSFNYNGLEAGVDLKPVKILTLTAGYSYIDNEQKNTRLSYTPKHRIIGGVKLELLGFMLNVNGEYVKDIFSNTTDKFDNYFVLNAKIAYTFLENYRVFADFNNITDKEYEAYRYYPSSSSIGYDYPMPGFNWRAGASVSL